MLKQQLLVEVKSGFSYKTLSDLEKVCNSHLSKNTQEANNLFVFVVRQVCSQVKTRLDAAVPTTVHHEIEQTVREPLIAAIMSLDSEDVSVQVVAFNKLIAACQRIKAI